MTRQRRATRDLFALLARTTLRIKFKSTFIIGPQKEARNLTVRFFYPRALLLSLLVLLFCLCNPFKELLSSCPRLFWPKADAKVQLFHEHRKFFRNFFQRKENIFTFCYKQQNTPHTLLYMGVF